MKKKIKKYLSIYLIILVLILQIPLNVSASSEVDKFEVGSCTINGNTYSCFNYTDPTKLSNQLQLYWVINGKVEHAPYTRALIVQLNKALGLTFKDTWFSDFFSYFYSSIQASGQIIDSFFFGDVFRVCVNDDLVGIALNDLTGYTLSDDHSSPNANITIPSNVINVTYNIVNNYLETYPETCDYITIETVKKQYALSHLDALSLYYSNNVNYANSLGTDYSYSLQLYTNPSQSQNTGFYTTDNSLGIAVNPDMQYAIYNMGDQNFSELCNDFGLSKDYYSIGLTELVASYTNVAYAINCIPYSSDGICYDWNCSTILSGDYQDYQQSVDLYKHSSSNVWNLLCSENGSVTIYKSGSVTSAIQNNTYTQNVYRSNTFNDFNINNNNDTNITYNNINNAQTTNQNIYNQTQQTTNNTTTNNNYNQSYEENCNNTTTIINNYYGDDSGGGGDDDDDDDDSIWDALLKALGDFLKKIGELLATILTGIISICTSVLDAIASIAESFTGITDFIASIFAFIPSDIVAVLTLGITLAVLISLIKIFRG